MPRGRLFSCLMVAALYVLSAKLGLALAFRNASVSPVWPPTGVAISALLLLGPRVWPGVFLGALLANFLFTPVALWVALGIAVGNTLEAVLAEALLARVGVNAHFLQLRRDFSYFLALGALLPTMVSATVGTAVLCLSGAAALHDFWALWITWWLGDAMGSLVVTPWLVGWGTRWQQRTSPTRLSEGALFTALLLALSVEVFFAWPWPQVARFPLWHLIFPLLAWAAMRFGSRMVGSALALLSGVAIAATVNHIGPFVLGSPNSSLLFLQLFIGSASLTAHFLAVSAEENAESRRKLQLRTEALQQSNEDLERFAHVASHDFQEPLRVIRLFTQLLVRKTTEEESRNWLQAIAASTDRMRDLTRALLELSRLNAPHAASEIVDCKVALQLAEENLRQTITEAGAVIACEALPSVSARLPLLTHVFQNLVGNAIKFRGEAPPKISISAERDDRFWIVAIRDNGIGFESAESERIFAPLYRLNRSPKIPGYGIGLAACRRIVENHLGGRIWATAAPGQGATFYFTVPAV